VRDYRGENGERAVLDEAPVIVVTGSYLTADEEGVLNDTYREAAALNIEIVGVRVSASGGFDTRTWQSTGIQYVLEIDSPASSRDVEQLRLRVEQVAEIPKALRLGCQVVRCMP
jgi:hypothetical protein